MILIYKLFLRDTSSTEHVMAIIKSILLATAFHQNNRFKGDTEC